MKKSLFLILSIFSVFFITDKVEALSFTATNGEEYTVDSEEKLLDYCYFTYVKNTNNVKYNFSLFKTSTGEYKFFFYSPSYNVGHYSNSTFYLYSGTKLQTYTFYIFKSNFEFSSSSTSTNTSIKTFVYSTNTIYTSSSLETVAYNPNTSVEEIESRYGVIPTYFINYYVNNEIYESIEVKQGESHELLTFSYNKNTHIFSGWQYDETIDLNNITSNININAILEEKDVIPVYIDFPITKNEFYALLVEVGVLIMIIFLKWCFPFKGGSDLK